MTAYSPSSSTAWGSVYYINEVDVDGLVHPRAPPLRLAGDDHPAGSSTCSRSLLAGAYRGPREVNWWFGMALLFLTLGFSLTGYLLPWDQKGYWATKVATNIMGGAPVLGPYLQTVVVGGTDYGNQTLTRFYGLHVGVLPALLVLCLAAHIALFRRHGLTPPAARRTVGRRDRSGPSRSSWTRVASVAVFGVAGRPRGDRRGAPLDAPADPSSADYPARPEWYFLSLFQMLKHFPGKHEMIGTIVIPDDDPAGPVPPAAARPGPARRGSPTSWPARFVFALVGGAGYLTVEALQADAADTQFQRGPREGRRGREAGALPGRQPRGRHPARRGRRSCCAATRSPTGGRSSRRSAWAATSSDGQGRRGEQTASDLKDFGSRAWVRGLLENPQAAGLLRQGPRSATAWPSGRRARSSRPSSSTTWPTSSPRSPRSPPT